MSLVNFLHLQTQLFRSALLNDDKKIKFEAEIYDFCKSLYHNKSAIFETRTGWRNVLGIRVETPVITI